MKFVQPIKDINQINQIRSALLEQNHGGHGLRNYMLFQLGIYSGYRISDIVNLKVSDIKKVLENGYFEIKENKTSKNRKVKIHPKFKIELQDYINNFKNMPDNSYIFPSQKYKSYVEVKKDKKYIKIKNTAINSPIDRKQAWQIFKNAADKIRLNFSIGTHGARKTFAYNLYIMSNKDIVLVQRILGHSSPDITASYIGITQDNIDELVCSLSY